MSISLLQKVMECSCRRDTRSSRTPGNEGLERGYKTEMFVFAEKQSDAKFMANRSGQQTLHLSY